LATNSRATLTHRASHIYGPIFSVSFFLSPRGGLGTLLKEVFFFYFFYKVTIHTLPHLECVRLVSKRSSLPSSAYMGVRIEVLFFVVFFSERKNISIPAVCRPGRRASRIHSGCRYNVDSLVKIIPDLETPIQYLFWGEGKTRRCHVFTSFPDIGSLTAISIKGLDESFPLI